MPNQIFVVIVIMLLFISGCGSNKPKLSQEELDMLPLAQRDGVPAPSGGFVLAVGGETITDEEVVAPLMETFRPLAESASFEDFTIKAKPQIEQVIIRKVFDILIFQQGKKNMGEQFEDALDKAVDSEVRKFVVSFEGDYAKAEQAIKDMGMDWADFRKYQKRMILSQSYIASQLPDQKPITYSEMKDSYRSMKDKVFGQQAMLKFQLIDIEISKLKVADPNKDSRLQAKELAEQLIGRLNADEDFGELAKQYSHGHRKLFGGLWKPIKPDSLAKPYDVLAAEAEKLDQGQLAGPIESGGHFFIMKLLERQQESTIPFEKVQKEVEARITFARRKQAIDELSAKLVQQASLANREKFQDFCLEKIYRACNQ